MVDGDFVVMTADASEHLQLEPLTAVLRRIREVLGMNVIYVSQFADSQQVTRFADAEPGDDAVQVGFTEDLEATYCFRVVDGRLGVLVRPPPPARTDRLIASGG